MGLSDRHSSSKPWKISITAKAEGFVTTELRMASPGTVEKKGFLAFLARLKRGSSMQQQQNNTGAICDASLCVKARLFFFKARLAAGQLRELHLRSRQGNLLHFRSSGKTSFSAPPSFQLFKGSSSCLPSSERAQSFLSRFLLSKRKRKESLLVCGAGIGAFTLFFLHNASWWATHFPSFALNAGSRLIGFIAKFIYRKCDSAGFKGAACFWKGIRGAISVFQMLMSLVRPIFAGNQFVTTALLLVLVGLLLMGKANKLQDFLHSKTRSGARLFKARMAMKLLLATQLIKRVWAHIGMKQAFLFMLLLAFLTNALSGLEEIN